MKRVEADKAAALALAALIAGSCTSLNQGGTTAAVAGAEVPKLTVTYSAGFPICPSSLVASLFPSRRPISDWSLTLFGDGTVRRDPPFDKPQRLSTAQAARIAALVGQLRRSSASGSYGYCPHCDDVDLASVIVLADGEPLTLEVGCAFCGRGLAPPAPAVELWMLFTHWYPQPRYPCNTSRRSAAQQLVAADAPKAARR